VQALEVSVKFLNARTGERDPDRLRELVLMNLNRTDAPLWLNQAPNGITPDLHVLFPLEKRLPDECCPVLRPMPAY
jgi:hypothetical protein